MKSYYAYKPSGEIVMVGACPDSMLDLQRVDGAEIAEGLASPGEYRDASGAVVALPPSPSPHHIFDYTTKKWIDPRTLADHKAAQWEQIKQARSNSEFGGFVWDGSTFDSDAISQQRIQGLVHIAKLDPHMTVDWTLADNTVRTLTSAEAIGVGLALAAHVNGAHVKARLLREQIEAATTVEQVLGVVWSA